MSTKFPFGPSATGAAAARALGDSTQVKWGAGFRTKTLGDFARVEVREGGTYALQGQRKTTEAAKVFVAQDYRWSFAPGSIDVGVDCDRGQRAGWYEDGNPSSTYTNFTYPGVGTSATGNGVNLPYNAGIRNYPARTGSNPRSHTAEVLTPANLVVQQFRFEQDVVAAVGRTRSKTVIAGYAHKAHFDDISGPATRPQFIYSVRYALTYAGRYEDGYVILSTLMSDEGRVNTVGKPLLSPAILRASRDGTGDFSGYLPIPRSNGQEFRILESAATRGAYFVLVAEKFNYYGPRVPSKDYRPPIWLMVSEDQGTTWLRIDVKEALAKWFSYPMWQCAKKVDWSPHTGPSADAAKPGFWARILTPMPANGVLALPDETDYSFSADVVQTFTQPPTPEGESAPPPIYTVGQNELYPFEATAGAFYNATLDYMAATSTVVAIGDDILLSYAFCAELPGPLAATTYDWYRRWGTRLVKIAKSGVVTVLAESQPSLDDDDPPEFLQSIVYLGNNTLLTKKVFGFDGIDFDVKFELSVNNGSSWTEFSPVGLPCSLKNQFIGSFYVENAIATPPEGEDKHRVLLPCWDPAKSAYVVYHSSDFGANWKKAGTIAKADSFRRVDSMVAGDGGGNFNTINYTADVTDSRPIDLAVPDRYPRSAA